MEKRYGALRTIATIYKILGIIVLAIAVLASLGSCLFSIMGGGILSVLGQQYSSGYGGADMSIVSLVGGILIAFTVLIAYGILGLALYGIGEGIYLFLAIEENTRATALLLQRQNQPQVYIER